jgi:mono/diheme cytochrome c family protein
MKWMTDLSRFLLGLVLTSGSLNFAAAEDAVVIQRGAYLATAADCAACHTAPGGKSMAGGLALPTPVGTILSSNITPSKIAGIGNYTLAQFGDALRKGIRADGQRLYPAMPYTSYAKITDEDVQALYAYFMKAVTPVDIAAPATRLPFPFNIRLSMMAWNGLFLDSKPFVPDASKGANWNRGAYLTRALAHCSVCHTSRNLLMAEDTGHDLAGGDVGNWFAPNITSDANSGVGNWSEQEITDYLQLGHVKDKDQAAGPMAEAIDMSLSHLTVDDLRAIATYLKTVKPVHAESDSRPPYTWGSPADDLNSIRGVPLPENLNDMTGPQLYDAHCATCHQPRGQGSFDGGLPPLFHNTALGRTNTNNLVMVMLDGVQRQAGNAMEVSMPGFRKTLSDQQIARLASYLTQRFGNPAAQVNTEQVKTLRTNGASSSLIIVVRIGMAVVLLLMAILVVFLLRKRTK